jgi:hypothetical protein
VREPVERPAPIIRPATATTARPVTAVGTGAGLSSSDLLNELVERAKTRWLPLIVLLALTVLDWRLHEDVGVSILLSVLAAAGVLYFDEVKAQIVQSLNLERYGSRVQGMFLVVPVALFFLLRGKGESFENVGGLEFADGLIIAVVLIGGVLLLQNFMPNIDASLAGFFETRDQYLPRTACIVVMLVLSAVLTFGAVHGEIADIQVLFGQQADKSAFPKLGNILLIVLLNMALAVAFLRPAPRRL